MDFTGRFTPQRRRRFELLSATAGPAGVDVKPTYEVQKQQKSFRVPSLLEQLPFEIIAETLSYLRVEDLAHVARTSNKLKQIVNSEDVWRLLCQKHFDCTQIMTKPCDMSWKTFFQQETNVEWDQDNLTVHSVGMRDTPLLQVEKNCVTKVVDSDAFSNNHMFETATCCSTKILTSGTHCMEFVTRSNTTNTNNNNYKFAVGLMDASASFNFSMSNYGDGETLSPPSTTLTQCFYWSDGQFSDILGASTLTGAFNFNTNVDHTYTAGDIIGMVVNMDGRCVTFFKNYARIAQYTFSLPEANNNNNSNNNSDSTETDLCMQIGAYLFEEGVSVTLRHAPFHLYSSL